MNFDGLTLLTALVFFSQSDYLNHYNGTLPVFSIYRSESWEWLNKMLIWTDVNWKFLKTKATLLIWRIRLSMIMIEVKTNSSITATNKRNFHANWWTITAMNKKESWIIDNKYFNCESMTLCLQRKANIRKLTYNKKTKELHLRKIKRPILVWLFYGWPSLPLLS